jgi:uncharacterized protein YggE
MTMRALTGLRVQFLAALRSRSGALAIGLACLIPPPPAIGQTTAPEVIAQGMITVLSEGRAMAVPDIAHLRLGVAREDEEAEDAFEAMSEAADDLLEALDAEGVALEDRQTGSLRLRPLWSRAPGRTDEVEGYEAATEIMVRLRDLERLGAVIDAAVDAGANRVLGLSFGLSDPRAIGDAARRDAIAEGRRRAEFYAEAAGVTLGGLLALDDFDNAAPMPRMMEMDVASSSAGDMPVAPGETVVTVRMRLVYAIEE